MSMIEAHMLVTEFICELGYACDFASFIISSGYWDNDKHSLESMTRANYA